MQNRSAGGTRSGVDSSPIERNLETISQLEAATVRARPRFVRICDRITEQAGTTWSIIAHAVWFAAWMTMNGVMAHPFDKFPYPLLTSVVSLEAIFLTLFVLASQNRLTQDADKRTHLDLQVNLLAEQEMTLALRMLRELCVKNGVEVSQFQAAAELEADTDIQDMAERVEATLPNCEAK